MTKKRSILIIKITIILKRKFNIYPYERMRIASACPREQTDQHSSLTLNPKETKVEIERTPDEILLEQVLREFAEKAELPGAILLSGDSHHGLFDLVNKAWGGRHGRDGRRKHLSDEDVAAEISKRIGRHFSRNQYQSMFGRRGRVLGKVEFYRQPVPRDVARGFLETAFAFWTVTSGKNGRSAPLYSSNRF